MIDLTTGVFSCYGSHLSVFAMQEGRQNANRGKRVNKNTGEVLYDAKLRPGFYFRNFTYTTDVHGNSSSTSSLYIDISNICMVWYK